jgi:hypothetical protein
VGESIYNLNQCLRIGIIGIVNYTEAVLKGEDLSPHGGLVQMTQTLDNLLELHPVMAT